MRPSILPLQRGSGFAGENEGMRARRLARAAPAGPDPAKEPPRVGDFSRKRDFECHAPVRRALDEEREVALRERVVLLLESDGTDHELAVPLAARRLFQTLADGREPCDRFAGRAGREGQLRTVERLIRRAPARGPAERPHGLGVQPGEKQDAAQSPKVEGSASRRAHAARYPQVEESSLAIPEAETRPSGI